MIKNITTLLIAYFTIHTATENQTDGVFTSFEQNHIRVATPHLFDVSNSILIRLDTLSENKIVFPIQGGKVISGYGARRGHSGADIKHSSKDSIYCVMDGVVRMAKPYSGYGNVIVVRHDCGLETVYSHNSKHLVDVGDRVLAGQAIGVTGRTGRATTEHLHFELRANGQAFNPNLLFDMSNGTPYRKALICKRKNNSVSLQFKN